MSVAKTWGTTSAERTIAFPCDDLAEQQSEALFRGITVGAPEEVVFRWLCQLRAAPYSYDWIDNFGRRSPRELTSGVDVLATGQRVMRIFELVSFATPVHLTIRADGPWFRGIVVSYLVVPGSNNCRLLAKLCVPRGSGWLGAIYRELLAWGDLVMIRKQMLTLRSLAERDHRRTRRVRPAVPA